MILINTGPLIVLFDPKYSDHKACYKVLKTIEEPLYTTEAVLTEVLYVFDSGSRGAEGVKNFFLGDYATLHALAMEDIERSFSLMNKYSDLPMDFSDATSLAVAEKLGTARISMTLMSIGIKKGIDTMCLLL